MVETKKVFPKEKLERDHKKEEIQSLGQGKGITTLIEKKNKVKKESQKRNDQS